MTSRSNETNRILDRFLEELGQPLPVVRARRASNRVLENLAGLELGLASDAGKSPVPHTANNHRWLPVAAVAAALFAAAVLVGALSIPSSAEPIARRLNGKRIALGDGNSIMAGKLIESDSFGGEVLALKDGSRVEMSAGVVLSINRAADGIEIDLTDGNIIVTAAKQRDGHLYVKTRDCVVTVVGTVFSVKAEASGSRVTVIEGEVHVQHGNISQTLLPGQQVATSSSMKALPLEKATAQLVMLQQPTVPAAPHVPVPAGNPPVNPDLVGEIKLILAPIDQVQTGDAIEKNKQLFMNLWNQNVGWGTAPNAFRFMVSGVQGRTVSFSNSKGETFSYGCADCSFVVSENGIAKVGATTEPGVEFKLSPDGNTLTATCHTVQCSILTQSSDISVGRRGESAIGGSFVGLSFNNFQAVRSSSQTITIPVSQLTAQQGNSLLFVVTK